MAANAEKKTPGLPLPEELPGAQGSLVSSPFSSPCNTFHWKNLKQSLQVWEPGSLGAVVFRLPILTVPGEPKRTNAGGNNQPINIWHMHVKFELPVKQANGNVEGGLFEGVWRKKSWSTKTEN